MARPSAASRPGGRQGLDLDLAGLGCLGLGDGEGQDPVGVRRLGGIGLQASRQADAAPQLATAQLAIQVALIFVLRLLAELALHREHVTGDRG